MRLRSASALPKSPVMATWPSVHPGSGVRAVLLPRTLTPLSLPSPLVVVFRVVLVVVHFFGAKKRGNFCHTFSINDVTQCDSLM